MYVVLIETSGNQEFIFATNKLRENIGASELVRRVGYDFLNDAVPLADEISGASYLVTRLADLVNQTLELEPGKVEKVVVASGKAILLTSDDETARNVIREVTRKVLREAPGLEVRGAIQSLRDVNVGTGTRIHRGVSRVHDRHRELQDQVPGPGMRFQRIPIVTECGTSGMPAEHIGTEGARPQLRSETTVRKREAAEQGRQRMDHLASQVGISLARNLEELEQLEAVDWLAVIHADGNGLGQIFLNLEELVQRYLATQQKPLTEAEYALALRDFSAQLNQCGEKAFQHALKSVWPIWQARRKKQGKSAGFLPLMPLVLGGDDLTVVGDGRLAIPFTVAYLEEFERQTATMSVVSGLAAARRDETGRSLPGRLAACAGVAIVKPHFPFYSAYELSDSLASSAKRIKRRVALGSEPYPCSAFDVQILYDASNPELDRVRQEWSRTHGDGTKSLTSRPFVVTPEDRLAEIPQASRDWVREHHVERLKEWLQTVTARDDEDRRILPNSLLHDLREGLFCGDADDRLRLALGRYSAATFGKLIRQAPGGEPSLFWAEPATNRSTSVHSISGLLDALDLAEFWDLPRNDSE